MLCNVSLFSESYTLDWTDRNTKTITSVTAFALAQQCAPSTRSAKSRVVVAGEAPVILLYFPAESPPRKPSGPSRNAQKCLFLPRIEPAFQAVQQLCFVDQEFHEPNRPSLLFDGDASNGTRTVRVSSFLAKNLTCGAKKASVIAQNPSRNRFSMRRKAAAVGSHRPRIALAPAASYPSSGRGRRVTNGGMPYLIARKFAQSRAVRPLPFAKG
jgi:hypothetical protein